MRKLLFTVALALLWLSLSSLRAQTLPVQAKLIFSQDSVALGEVIELKMILIHPEGTEVFFPSRRRDFLPFEWIDSERLPTETRDDKLINAMVYRLRTFKLAPRQGVTLPYGFRSNTDTLRNEVISPRLHLAQRITTLSDSLGYRTDPELVSLGTEESSVPWVLWIMGGLLLLGVLAWMLRPPLLRMLKRRSLRQEWSQLRKQIQRLPEEADQGELFDQLSRLWRQWLDPEEKWSLLSLTTTEMQQRLPQIPTLSDAQREHLLSIAQASDQAIYAGRNLSKEKIEHQITHLLPILEQEYRRRYQAISRKEA